MIRILLALAALLFIVPAAQAASFDCSKAATSFERAICNHPDLSTADEVLAQAYATALGGLSADTASSVKATQHSWLDFAARTCSDDARPIPGAYTDEQARCLMTTIKDRITSLEASRMQGGYRFYPVEGYLVEKDTDAQPDSYNKVATKHYATVNIDDTDDVAAAFNAMTGKMLISHDEQIGEDTHLFEPGTTTLKTGELWADINVSTTVKAVTNERITMTTEEDWYGHGAAHPNYSMANDHFLISKKRALVPSDVFKGKGWENKLAGFVIKGLKEQLADSYFPDSEMDMPKIVADPSRWDFAEGGLIIQFQPYEVAAYALGAPSVTIPWTAMADDLVDHAQAIIAAY